MKLRALLEYLQKLTPVPVGSKVAPPWRARELALIEHLALVFALRCTKDVFSNINACICASTYNII